MNTYTPAKPSEAPTDADIAIDGLYYKIGARGFAYLWNGREWIRSNKAPAITRSAIERRKRES